MRIRTGIAAELPGGVRLCLAKTVSRLDSLGVEDFVDRRLRAPSVYLLSHKGKLLRPTLVFLGAMALHEKLDEYVDLAAAIELLHTSSLIHDDLIDRDSKRRDASSVHAKYGDGAAVLAGDALISKAIQLSSRYGPEVISEIAGSAMEMCAGEMLDVACQKADAAPTLGAYLRIASLKSASLIGVASAIAAVHRGDALAESMRSFGSAAGVAFQIRDDVMELAGRKGTAAPSNGGTNLVLALERRYRMGREKAMRKAIALNNRYLDRAVGAVRGGNASLLGSCADFMRLYEA